jgi:HEPN domain-containing protein
MSASDPAGLAAEWLRYARDDLRAAKRMMDDDAFQPRHVCFNAQQAAEKAIKALLVAAQIEFVFTHDLDQLLTLVPEDRTLETAGLDLTWLSRWAIEPRYPTGAQPGPDVAKTAVRLAERVVELVATDLEADG